ncbi:hypothetical protein ACLKA6_017828 [Drosophila palustris]
MDKKSKTKSKTKGLKANKESSTKLDVDLWEHNEDRFTSCEFNTERRANNKATTTAGAVGVVCPGNATALTLTASGSAAATSAGKEVITAPQLSTTPTAISIAGCASGTALVTLDSDAVTIETTEPERGNWTGRFDFLLSLLGYSVGLGNVWRFPYLCYNNGGGAFLIPFTIMLIIAGLPLMFMELSFGQYAALGPVAIYRRFCPLFRGLGTGMIIVSAIVMLYYNLIIAWTIFYMFASFRTQLPWQNCEPEWSTESE